MMLRMGASTIDTPGAQCTWDGMSSKHHLYKEKPG
jgi:hypothetical protein